MDWRRFEAVAHRYIRADPLCCGLLSDRLSIMPLESIKDQSFCKRKRRRRAESIVRDFMWRLGRSAGGGQRA